MNEANPLMVSSIAVRADGKEMVAQIEDLPQTLRCLIATYFILDIAFPSTLKKTLCFLQVGFFIWSHWRRLQYL